MSKGEKRTNKACKTNVFDDQLCKFMTFFMPSSSWLRKLPIVKYTYDAEITSKPNALLKIN